MSSRAAARLESLGFSQVYRYAAGKMDWLAAGLPREGRLAAIPNVGEVAARDAPTCELSERVGEVRQCVTASGWDMCVVVNEARVVLGLLSGEAWQSPADRSVESAMRPGPATFRPSLPLEEMAEYMRHHDLRRVLVTTSDGELIGVLGRADAERAAGLVESGARRV